MPTINTKYTVPISCNNTLKTGESIAPTWLAYLDNGLTKNSNNPLIALGAGGTFDDVSLRDAAIVIDEDGYPVEEVDGMWLYYGGFDGSDWSIGLAKSSDGITWTKYGSNPVQAKSGAGWYQNGIYQPAVIKKDDGTRVMLAQGIASGDVPSIGCLSSSDGLTWSDEGQKLTLSDFQEGVTAVTEIGVPSIIKKTDGVYLMICECLVSGITNGWRVFGATASDPTDTWTVLNSGDPIFSPTGSGFESVGVANAHITERTPGEYFILYNGITTDLTWRLAVAYTTDSTLTSWTRYGNNPVLMPGLSGEWDDVHTEASFLLKEVTARLRLYYQGFATGASAQIGLASFE